MSTVGNTYPSMIDLYKNKEGGLVTSTIIEMLTQINPILADMIVRECNQGAHHLTTVRSGLPSATWRELYKGVQPSKATNKQVTDATGMLEAWSEIDAKLVDLAGSGAGQFRLNEAQAFLQAMSNEMSETIFYGSAANEFQGFAPRFNDLAAENGGQIVDAGGTGPNLTSIWFVVWGENTCHGLYPQGTSAGLTRTDKGMQTKETDDGVYDVYREKFTWDMGLSVRDWRYVVRIANVDIDALQAGTLDLYALMRKAYYKLYQRQVAGGRAAIYCNTDVMEALDGLATNNGTTDNFVRLSPMELEGEQVMGYRGMPLREVDALINTESQVV